MKTTVNVEALLKEMGLTECRPLSPTTLASVPVKDRNTLIAGDVIAFDIEDNEHPGSVAACEREVDAKKGTVARSFLVSLTRAGKTTKMELTSSTLLRFVLVTDPETGEQKSMPQCAWTAGFRKEMRGLMFEDICRKMLNRTLTVEAATPAQRKKYQSDELEDTIAYTFVEQA